MKRQISMRDLKERIRRKTNPVLVETINAAKKHEKWKDIAKILSGSTRRHSTVNLFEIDEQTKAGDIVIVPGKVLSKGDLTKKVRICSLSMSKTAKEKLKETKSESVSILEEIHKNPKADGVKILR